MLMCHRRCSRLFTVRPPPPSMLRPLAKTPRLASCTTRLPTPTTRLTMLRLMTTGFALATIGTTSTTARKRKSTGFDIRIFPKYNGSDWIRCHVHLTTDLATTVQVVCPGDIKYCKFLLFWIDNVVAQPPPLLTYVETNELHSLSSKAPVLISNSCEALTCKLRQLHVSRCTPGTDSTHEASHINQKHRKLSWAQTAAGRAGWPQGQGT